MPECLILSRKGWDWVGDGFQSSQTEGTSDSFTESQGLLLKWVESSVAPAPHQPFVDKVGHS